MTIKERAIAVARYLLGRLSEPSTIKGLTLRASGFRLWRVRNTSQGEGIAQIGLLTVGLLNAALPQNTLYQSKGNG